MRNKYPGICYRCKKIVEAGKGHFQRSHGTWIVQHANCAIDNRKLINKETNGFKKSNGK